MFSVLHVTTMIPTGLKMIALFLCKDICLHLKQKPVWSHLQTSLAHVIANLCRRRGNTRFVTHSATSATTANIREVIRQAQNEQRLCQRKTILFIDEIHRFNKSQQVVIVLAPHCIVRTSVFTKVWIQWILLIFVVGTLNRANFVFATWNKKTPQAIHICNVHWVEQDTKYLYISHKKKVLWLSLKKNLLLSTKPK